MATFINQATLNYNGNTRNSNIVTGEILEVLSATKTAVNPSYNAGDEITYVITLTNTGAAPLNGLTLTDNLGAYPTATGTATPLDYNTNTILYYNNGTLQPTPTVTAVNPLTVTGINVPANGTATIVYQTTANAFASPALGGTVTNTATFTGAGISTPVTASETITADNTPDLMINKAVSPTVVAENGTLTYTFTIQNYGNVAATPNDIVSVSDTFNPILNPITVTLDGTTLTRTTDYVYNDATGEFETIPGRITVPAATFTQNPDTGEYTVTPGVTTLTVTGTV